MAACSDSKAHTAVSFSHSSLSTGLWHVINCCHYQRQLAQWTGPFSGGLEAPLCSIQKKWGNEKRNRHTYRGKGHIERVTEWWMKAKRSTRVVVRDCEDVMPHSAQCNTLPKRDCGTVNNLSENIFLGLFHRPTNPPWALFRRGWKWCTLCQWTCAPRWVTASQIFSNSVTWMHINAH